MLEATVEVPESSSSSTPITTSQSTHSTLYAYAITIFLSAFLLFQVQLIFAKYILPLFGGAPAVWNTCMFSFQILLLLGYGYAHLLKSRGTIATQSKIHGVLLLISAIFLVILWLKWGTPLTPGATWKPTPLDNPVLKILELVGITVALPFFMLSTTGPLLQSWVARSTIFSSPYRLYAISNAGSLLGLLTYPFLMEWVFTTKHQAWLWSSGYLLFAALCMRISLRLSKQTISEVKEPSISEESSSQPKTVRYLLWLALSTCSTVILLSSTSFICENIAAIPLLWVVPLSIYLLSFMLTFDSSRWYRRSIFWPLYFAAMGLELSRNFSPLIFTPLVLIGIYSLKIFAVCMVCHGELARSKPVPEHLTKFYFTVASGGVLGGAFVILIASQIFRGYWEFYGALIGCGYLLFIAFVLEDPSGSSERPAWIASLIVLSAFLLPHIGHLIPGLANFLLFDKEYYAVFLPLAIWIVHQALRGRSKRVESQRSQFAWQSAAALLMLSLFAIFFCGYTYTALNLHILYRERNFFGLKYVRDQTDRLGLAHGNTLHGTQFKNPMQRNLPTLYYSLESGVGALLQHYPRTSENSGHLRVGVIGMGVGTLAAYGQPGDYMRFYEIDPAVVQLSLGPQPIFSFLHDSLAMIQIVLGDARLSLEREAEQGRNQQFDVFVVDAFNGDSIPVHLLTQEALTVYRKHLRGSDSVLAFHITNRYLDLTPVLEGLARGQNLAMIETQSDGSTWALLSANPSMLQLPGLAEKTKPRDLDREPLFWTDNYSNLFRVMFHSRSSASVKPTPAVKN